MNYTPINSIKRANSEQSLNLQNSNSQEESRIDDPNDPIRQLKILSNSIKGNYNRINQTKSTKINSRTPKKKKDKGFDRTLGT